MKTSIKIPALITSVILSIYGFIMPIFAEAEDTLPDFNQSNNGALMAKLFFILVGLMIAGALAALIVPIIREKIQKNKVKNTDSEVRRRSPVTKNSMKRFWIVWAGIFVVLIIVAMIGMAFLNRILTEYESIQPGYEAEKIYQTYFKTINTDKLWKYINYSTGDFETATQAKAYFNELITSNGSKTDYHEVISDDSSIHKYAVKVGEYTLGYFTVGTDENKKTEKYNYSFPKLNDIVIEIKPIYGVSVYAPENAVVLVNGISVSKANQIGDTIVLEDADYFPEDDESYRHMINYSITGLYRKPVVEVLSYRSITLNLVYDEETKKYITKRGDIHNDEIRFSLEYNAEQESYSAAKSYINMVAAAYNNAYEQEKTAQEQFIFDTLYKAEVEKLLLEEAKEKTTLFEAEQARVLSAELKGLYEERVKYLGENLNIFFYSKTTTNSKSAALALIQPKSEYYTKTQTYYNWGDYRVSTFNFSDFSTDNYKWVNDNHTVFSCEVHLNVNLYGYRYDKRAYTNWTEAWDVEMQVCISTNKNGLIYHVAPIE